MYKKCLRKWSTWSFYHAIITCWFKYINKHLGWTGNRNWSFFISNYVKGSIYDWKLFYKSPHYNMDLIWWRKICVYLSVIFFFYLLGDGECFVISSSLSNEFFSSFLLGFILLFSSLFFIISIVVILNWTLKRQNYQWIETVIFSNCQNNEFKIMNKNYKW